ncbi:LANO_0H15544g1_1 [Lachancea nothofagi CBS 11611]|uniref:LANO_0H15544g1_1 n=1 Tax=Lachancea nothofagi CBS 11611 TaxID=1266666 RepID=A0A1G4KMM0_9SACH|nr:LANO_0H15544g1_1 [Lachancea nothofagi CBS 11611]
MGVADLIKKFETFAKSDDSLEEGSQTETVAETKNEGQTDSNSEKNPRAELNEQQTGPKVEETEASPIPVNETKDGSAALAPVAASITEEAPVLLDEKKGETLTSSDLENTEDSRKELEDKPETADDDNKTKVEDQENEQDIPDDEEPDKDAATESVVEENNTESAPSKKNKKKKNRKKNKKTATATAASEPVTEVVAQETSDSLGIPESPTKEQVQVLNAEVQEQEAESVKHENTTSPESTPDTRFGRDDPFQFGQRQLTEDSDIWNHNAWDNVEWGEEQVSQAEEKISEQQKNPVSDFDRKLYNSNPARYWDIFYKNNKENFFKDRKWLQIEFPSLYEATKEDAGPKTIFEIGCGAGNTMFPILSQNQNEHLRVIGADFAPKAVDLVRTSEHFDSKYAHATVWDLANPEHTLPEGVEPQSVDIAVMIFVFSALSPDQWTHAMENLHKMMRPGGKILFRDYGRYDLAQVRFKKNRLLGENFYIRGDGTRVYFFTEEELRDIFTEKYFTENQIGTDRRLLVNRKRQIKMYRVWLQAIFEVPS